MCVYKNGDYIKVNEIKPFIGELVKANGGYCPCCIERSEDTICPCKEYRETGHCHCGMYKE